MLQTNGETFDSKVATIHIKHPHHSSKCIVAQHQKLYQKHDASHIGWTCLLIAQHPNIGPIGASLEKLHGSIHSLLSQLLSFATWCSGWGKWEEKWLLVCPKKGYTQNPLGSNHIPIWCYWYLSILDDIGKHFYGMPPFSDIGFHRRQWLLLSSLPPSCPRASPYLPWSCSHRGLKFHIRIPSKEFKSNRRLFGPLYTLELTNTTRQLCAIQASV